MATNEDLIPDGAVRGKNGHLYPDRYAPGKGGGSDLDVAWEILDMIKPGVIPLDVRAFLAGMITGALKNARTKQAL